MIVGVIGLDATCYGGQGTGLANASGGTAPYSYTWNSTPQQYTQTADLYVGTWSVTITDANGCTTSGNVNINLTSCSGFTTITQGGWGAKCNGNNWGCYRDNNFAGAFPSGLTIGAGARQLKLTSAASVQSFLPSSTTARKLELGMMIDPPGNSYKNVLAGHAVALTLNIGFDNHNANFSSSTTPLADLIVSSGTFAGWSVGSLLNEANNILGGISSAYSASQINSMLDIINNNYDNGTQNLNALACPCPVLYSAGIVNEPYYEEVKTETASKELIVNPGISTFEAYPNPFNSTCTLHFKTKETGLVEFKIYNTKGQLIENIYTGVSDANQDYYFTVNGENLNPGMYMVILTTEQGSEIKKISLIR